MILSIFSHAYWPLRDLWRNICSDPLPIFKLGCLSYCCVISVLDTFCILDLYKSLLLFSCPVMSNSLRHHGLQHARTLSLTISRSLPKFMSIASVMPSSHLILWHPLPLLPSIFPGIRDFSNESAVPIRWPKYWNFNFNLSLSNDYSGLISLKIDWFDFP